MPLDIGVGILFSLGIATWFGIPLTPLLVAFGIAAALLPDIDIITKLWGPWRHRGVTHWPIIYVPLALAVWMILGAIYGTLFALAAFAHFVHDTFGIGNGVAWGAPFSQRRYLYFKARTRTNSSGNWVTDYYFRPNPLAYIEYGVLIIAVAALVLYVAL